MRKWIFVCLTNFITLSIILLATIVSGCAQNDLPNSIPNPGTVGERLDAFIQPYVEMGVFNGTVLVAAGDHILVSKSYGMASYELGIPNRFNTQYRIASLSKQFTQTAIGVLMDKGALSADSKLSEFIPDYPNGDNITIDHLLNHRSGVRHTNEVSWMKNRSRMSLNEIIDGLKKEPLDFEPDTKRKYSNGGYAVLAKIIEIAGGMSFERFLSEQVLAPMGLSHTGHLNTYKIIDGMANGYLPGISFGKRSKARFYPAELRVGGGSLYSRAEDVWHLFRKTYQHMVHSEETATYLFGDRTGEGEITGRSPGFVAKVYIDITNDIVVVSLANNYSWLGPWAKNLYKIVMEESDDFKSLVFAKAVMTKKQAEYYSGRYFWDGDYFEIYLGDEGYLIYYDKPNDWRVAFLPLEDGSFYMPYYDRICEFKGSSHADSFVFRSRVIGDDNLWTAEYVGD